MDKNQNVLNKLTIDINSLVSGMSDFVLLKDLDSNYITANNNLINELGLKGADQLVGYSDFSISHPLSDNAAFYRHLDLEAIKRNQTIEGILSLPFQGDMRPYFYKKHLLKDIHGNSVATLSHVKRCKDPILLRITKELLKSDPLQCRQNKARSFIMNQNYYGIDLTANESDCLFFLLRRKNVTEIAQLLNTPTATIEVYIEKIKSQLKADNLNDIVDISVENHFAHTVPSGILSRLYRNQQNQITKSVLLTQREMDCAKILINGSSVKVIATALHISPRTVETHINNLKEKLNCSNKIALILKLKELL